MSSTPADPGDIVSDGVAEDGTPVPRDPGSASSASGTGTTGAAAPTSGGPSGGAEGHAPGAGDANKVPGPAEEQDEKTADDRGLTTDTSPD
ncbi:hypothetical protein E7Y32_07675 [Arthrobacter sp. UKPF54-2]|uniref:hypothetical protein n=1 Tax=Arthrobacter sp. UKPF54-2 TaxID=2600159 RepID=UPI0011B1735C|nr:hypothetical protein [Arthrobacter sp. UKPF54-2]QDY90100.1 hypothetical protein E7Y32_07675 [Arthrobacter sp. UKPF54-2]